jgi:hypothetical protein
LRGRQRHYGQVLEELHQWKSLVEKSLSSVSEQGLRHALRADDIRSTQLERDAAKQTQTALQE